MKLHGLVMFFVVSAMMAVWPAHAQSVYRCRDAKGALAFQDKPCAAGQAQSEVAVEPAPAYAASPDYGVDKPARTSRVTLATSASKDGSAPDEMRGSGRGRPSASVKVRSAIQAAMIRLVRDRATGAALTGTPAPRSRRTSLR